MQICLSLFYNKRKTKKPGEGDLKRKCKNTIFGVELDAPGEEGEIASRTLLFFGTRCMPTCKARYSCPLCRWVWVFLEIMDFVDGFGFFLKLWILLMIAKVIWINFVKCMNRSSSYDLDKFLC